MNLKLPEGSPINPSAAVVSASQTPVHPKPFSHCIRYPKAAPPHRTALVFFFLFVFFNIFLVCILGLIALRSPLDQDVGG